MKIDVFDCEKKTQIIFSQNDCLIHCRTFICKMKLFFNIINEHKNEAKNLAHYFHQFEQRRVCSMLKFHCEQSKNEMMNHIENEECKILDDLFLYEWII